jgi:hypothetical protein
MKHLILLIAFLLVSSTAAVGQSGHAGQEKKFARAKGSSSGGDVSSSVKDA